MDIGKVSKISKLPVSTIRYYEEKGLIRAIGRNGLRHAAACKASNHLACPKFLRYLKVAGYRSYRPKNSF
ncbi:hypothetical protein TUM4261_40660 [Shewanella sp. c952]|uniref:MerR family DNA-binding transcriptional regulator n=1 Tax=Shewanella sp. c952 TaxID=2815913 RepID=UPI001BBA32B0|nr:MerR family DNA-binding transcriptional regulator [Shewanella sp. c952]GIU19077.1 hypothetical protein TUM4261_40660 [Shewanella sp. c952]